MISLWGCLPVSSFINQATQMYSLIYLNLKPFGGIHEKEFPEGADIKAPKRIYFSLELFHFETWPFALVRSDSRDEFSRYF